MARLMSCTITVDQVRRRIKTVTRRIGWDKLKPGDKLQLVEKGMGLRKGEKAVKLALVRVVSVRKEKLARMAISPYGRIETTLEGYPPGTEKHDPLKFIEMFCEAMDCDSSTEVNRIQWEYLD